MSTTSDISDACAPPPTAASPTIAEPARHTTAGDLHTIIGRICAASRSAPPVPGWEFIKPDGGLKQLAIPPAKVLERLQSEFSEADLLASRVVRRHADDTLKLAAVFGDGRSAFSPITREGKYVDVFSARGALTSPLCCLPAARFWAPSDAKTARQFVILAATDDDVELLRRFGLQCTWIAGLTQLTAGQVKSLELLNRQAGRISFVIAACSVAHLKQDIPPFVESALHKLNDALDFYGPGVTNLFQIWQPGKADLSTLAMAQSFRDSDKARTIFYDSFRTSIRALPDVVYPARPQPELDLAAARTNLENCVRGFASHLSPRTVKNALAQYRAAYTKITTTIDHANATGDLRRSMLLEIENELTEFWFSSKPLVKAAEQIIASRTAPDLRPATAAENEDRLKLADRIVKVCRALEK